MALIKSKYTESELASEGWKYAYSLTCKNCGEDVAVYEMLSAPRKKLYLTEGSLAVHIMECKNDR